jgi:hypothetical protein
MKKYQIHFKSIFFLVLMLIITSCKHESVNPTEKAFDYNSFTGIANYTGADISITKSPEFDINVTGDHKMIENLKLEVQNGILVLEFRKKLNFNFTQLKFDIKMPELNQIELHGSGSAVSKDTFVVIKDVKLEINGSGSINTCFNTTGSTYADISGSGDIKLAGKSNSFDISINGSGEIKAFEYIVNQAKVEISGSGNTEINAINNLNVEINGSGSVTYKGKPAINSDISGSGSIEAYNTINNK